MYFITLSISNIISSIITIFKFIFNKPQKKLFSLTLWKIHFLLKWCFGNGFTITNRFDSHFISFASWSSTVKDTTKQKKLSLKREIRRYSRDVRRSRRDVKSIGGKEQKERGLCLSIPATVRRNCEYRVSSGRSPCGEFVPRENDRVASWTEESSTADRRVGKKFDPNTD